MWQSHLKALVDNFRRLALGQPKLWRIQMLLCFAPGPARRWIDREFCGSSKRLSDARRLREVVTQVR